MKVKSRFIDLVLCIIVTICITALIRPSITDKITQAQALNKKHTEQITTKIISQLSGGGENIKSSQIKYPQVGEKYALIHNEEYGLSKEIYYGDSKDILDLSIGQSKLSKIPGQNKPILLAGHNGTHFRLLPSLEVGDQVQIDTSYGSYVYEINKTEILNEDAFEQSQLDQNEELLIMYTCYPFDAIKTNQRYFVYAKKVFGPLIEDEGKWLEE